MADVTQIRALPQTGSYVHSYLGTVLQKSTTEPLPAGYQRTVSWRTNKRTHEDLEAGEREFSSHTEFVRALKDEHDAQYDTGHNFETEKYTVTLDNPKVDMYLTPSGPLAKITNRYTGYAYPGSALVGRVAMSAFNPSDSKIIQQGARAIAASSPTKPEAGLSQFLGELREKFPTLIGINAIANKQVVELSRRGGRQRTRSHASVGDEYLNYQFGLVPLISDVEKFAVALARVHEIVYQLKRNSGRSSHVSTSWQVETESTTLAVGSPNPMVIKNCPGSVATELYYYTPVSNTQGVTITRQVENSSKFTGAFQYHLSEAHDFLSKMERFEQLANGLLGTQLDVDTLWELTPWSWFIDWFAGVGTFLKNVVALSNDNLVMRYGYMLNETRVSINHTLMGIQPRAGWTVPPSVSMTELYVRKKRTKATPYGFGVDLGTLSPQRWAILAALGMTKSGSVLR